MIIESQNPDGDSWFPSLGGNSDPGTFVYAPWRMTLNDDISADQLQIIKEFIDLDYVRIEYQHQYKFLSNGVAIELTEWDRYRRLDDGQDNIRMHVVINPRGCLDIVGYLDPWRISMGSFIAIGPPGYKAIRYMRGHGGRFRYIKVHDQAITPNHNFFQAWAMTGATT